MRCVLVVAERRDSQAVGARRGQTPVGSPRRSAVLPGQAPNYGRNTTIDPHSYFHGFLGFAVFVGVV